MKVLSRAIAGLLSITALAAATVTVLPPDRAAADDAAFSPDQKAAIEKIVKDYLVANPEVLLEVQNILETKMEKQQAEKAKAALAENAKDVFRRTESPVAGNLDGDITVTEFFDYNCGFCRRSFPDVTKLIAADGKVRVMFKEFPILSKGSEEAARVALAARLQGKYWEVHKALFENKGQNNGEAALHIAEKLGLDMAKLKADMTSAAVNDELKNVKDLATKLGINGTPHFLVGDKSIAGAPDTLLEQLTADIGDMRKAGCAYC